MTRRARLAAAVALAALAGCTSSSAPTGIALLSEPSSVAVFRGVTVKSGLDPSPTAAYPYRPYLAVANAAANDVSILDGVDDTLIAAPAPTRGLVYSVPGRPMLLAAADLGDRKPDLLVVVTAGDLPWLGGTQLRVLKTWGADGALVDRTDGRPAVDFGADVLALVAFPPDAAAPGRVKLVAALAGERVATVTFSRATAGDLTAIDVDAAQATVTVSAPLGFQPLQLAALPGERTRVFAASTDPLPGGVQGVAEVDVTGTPAFTAALSARAPTRLVAAAHLAAGEASLWSAADGTTPRDAGAFTGAPVDRILAVLDESGCGLAAPIACGLVAIDPVTRDLVVDPTPAGTFHAPFRAPIRPQMCTAPDPSPSSLLALGVVGPPAAPPSAAEPQYAGTFLRVQLPNETWSTTAVAGLAASDGTLTFVDVGRWMVPSNQAVFSSVGASVQSTRPTGTAATQFLTLRHLGGGTVAHTDPSGLSTSVQVTGGFTPTDRWTVIREGALPGLTSRRAEVYADGSLALQATDAAGAVQGVVRVWDPTLAVSVGDIVVLDATGLGTCTTFEATITAVRPPSAATATAPAHPGGSLALEPRTVTVPASARCFASMQADAGAARSARYLATIRAGGYVLVRGVGAAAVVVGRPEVGERFEVRWQPEEPLAAACPLPPARPWQSAWSGSASAAPAPPACDETCRGGCVELQRARLARRVLYVEDPPAAAGGPALAFTLALENPALAASRDLALTIDTADGRAPFRVAPSAGFAVDARAVVPFDRTPWDAAGGPRLLVPYAGGVLMDATPSLATNGVGTIH